MRTTLSVACLCALFVSGNVMAQESERVYETTTETYVGGNDSLSYDLFTPFQYTDATTLTPGRVDLRLSAQWITRDNANRLNDRDNDDDVIVTPLILWGVAERLELFIQVPVWVGDGSRTGDDGDGNGDLSLGGQYQFIDEGDWMPAWAIRSSTRVPTGNRSNGVDSELRLIMSKQCADWVRSHVNVWGTTVNGDNNPNARHFQWGVAFGFDGDLTEGWRWIVDYAHRSSVNYGSSNINTLEVGTEWTIDDTNRLGFGVLVGLDDNDDTPNLAALVNYSYTLTY